METIHKEKFNDRHEAGKILADLLQDYANKPDTIVFALPRGGVPVAYEIAKTLSLPLDVFIVRKLGVPGHEELAMGAIASGGTALFNEDIINQLHISPSAIDTVVKAEEKELERREIHYRGSQPFPELRDKIIILVDDGIATGATMRVAIKALYRYKPAKIVVAVPVAASSTCDEIMTEVNDLVCALKPVNFYAVAAWYDNFTQTSDTEVAELLLTERRMASAK